MTTPLPQDDRWLDLALGQGVRADLDRLREEVARDPLAALEYAETRDLVERMRGLTTEPSAGFAARMDELGRSAEQRFVRRRPRPSLPFAPALLAAAALFLLLALLDPLSLRTRRAPVALPAPVAALADARAPEPLPEVLTSALARAAEGAKRLAPDSQLTAAWTRFSAATREQQLSDWLSARNATGLMRLDHELRTTASMRMDALRDRGLNAAVDRRVRDLAATLADEIEAGLEEPFALSLALRAVVAAGLTRDAAVEVGAERLFAALPTLEAGPLAMALCALGEAAAATGRSNFAAVAEHGNRLVRSVLDVSDDVWSRRRPRLLQPTEPAANLAAAGRFLGLASAFGIDADEARAVRLLLLAHLCERRDAAVETPDVPTAVVYGFGDLLGEDERTALERQLRRWRPDGLVPDWLALQQLAATRSPQHLGYARWQLDLRRVVAIATPAAPADRAALCLCLANAFADEMRARALAGL